MNTYFDEQKKTCFKSAISFFSFYRESDYEDWICFLLCWVDRKGLGHLYASHKSLISSQEVILYDELLPCNVCDDFFRSLINAGFSNIETQLETISTTSTSDYLELKLKDAPAHSYWVVSSTHRDERDFQVKLLIDQLAPKFFACDFHEGFMESE